MNYKYTNINLINVDNRLNLNQIYKNILDIEK